jgi:transposase-like protein
MNCKRCGGPTRKRGLDRKGRQRYYCAKCYQSFIPGADRKGLHSRISIVKPEIEKALAAGMAIRNIARVHQISTHTIAKIRDSED